MTMQLNQENRLTLLQIARKSIQQGLSGAKYEVTAAEFNETLQVNAACFVTLSIDGNLRGCIGHLSAIQPLVVDVNENAYSAAFQDPRFAPLSQNEFAQVAIEISVLTPPQPMSFASEADLLKQIRPHHDGLILEDIGQRGTFLPTVWESLPDKQDFWKHLKLKAGLPVDHWSDSIKVWRYETLSFSE